MIELKDLIAATMRCRGSPHRFAISLMPEGIVIQAEARRATARGTPKTARTLLWTSCPGGDEETLPEIIAEIENALEGELNNDTASRARRDY